MGLFAAGLGMGQVVPPGGDEGLLQLLLAQQGMEPEQEGSQEPDRYGDPSRYFAKGLGSDLFGFDGLLGGLIPPLTGSLGRGGYGGYVRSGAGGSSSGGFTAGPPGTDFGGYDTSPGNLITRQGITGIPQAVRRLLQAERVLGAPGLSENVVSDFRDRETQARLYNDHLAGRHPAPVAPPGQSYHEQGEAFDISSSWLAANPRVSPWLERHGFTFDVPGEPWHAHFEGMGGTGRPIAGTRTLTRATGNQNRPVPTERRRTPFTSNRPTSTVRSPYSPYLRQRR